ncbi:MAG: TIGR04086 family membrane protein [Bacillaceae bacterium]|nr:TIGR04086 family membrane protein [Bacillaceae bacterium]
MKGNVTTGNNHSGSASAPVLFGLLIAFILVLLGSIITSLLFHYSSISESSMPVFAYTVNGISLVIGGMVAGKKAGQRGWYHGSLTGLFYFMIMALIGFLAFDATLKLTSLYYLIGSFLCGSIGGVIGVNYFKSSR